MNAQHSMHKSFYAVLLVSVLVLPGCGVVDWVKNKFGCESAPAEQPITSPMSGQTIIDDSEVLVRINGKPAVTVKSFERDFDMLLEENPQLKSVLPFMPEARKNFLTGLVNQEIVDMYVAKNDINKKDEYKQDLERLQRSVVRMLNTKYFAAAHPVQVQDTEVQAYYDANKDKMQELVISRGGMQTVGVQFEKESDAKAFAQKATGKNLSDVAKTESMTEKIKDFKLVNKQSVGIDPVLRNKIVALEKTPATEMVKVSDKTFWVVQVTTKEEAKYRAFEEVREPIRQLVEREKGNEALQKAIEGLKQDMHVAINADYFKASETMTGEQGAQPDMAHMQNSPEQPAQQAQVAPLSRAA